MGMFEEELHDFGKTSSRNGNGRERTEIVSAKHNSNDILDHVLEFRVNKFFT